MRGSVVTRGKGRYALVFDHYVDGKRKQKWISFKGTKKQADEKLTELLGATNDGTFVEPSKVTLVEHLRAWIEKSVKPMRRPETARVYQSMINTHIANASIASIQLQRVRPTDLERFYAELKLAPASIGVIHALIHRALKKAVKDRLLTVNPAIDLERRRPSKDHSQGAREHCWSATEARAFIEVAKKASPQLSAFYCLALDTGARKSELAGLKWTDLDLDAATLTIERQLDKAGTEPVFGVTKTGRARTVTLGAETVTQLRAHKKAQSALKMKNRTTYQDFGLLFAKEAEDLQTPEAKLGQPVATLSEARFQRIVAEADIKRIVFHGLRHTCATLLLQAGTPVHVVAQRLGHAKVTMTLEVYAHALPNQQQDAAARLGQLLHG